MAPAVPMLQLQAARFEQREVSYSDDDFADEDFSEDSEEEPGDADTAPLTARGVRPEHPRPGNPEPPEFMRSDRTERTIDPRTFVDEPERDRWDASVGTSGARECPIRVRAPLEEGPGWRLGASAPELGPRPNLLDEESNDGDQNQESAGQGYPGYSWRETLCRFPGLIQLYPLAAGSEAGLEEFASDADMGAPGIGAIDGLEGNEEYLNGHPSSSSQGLQAAAAVAETQPKAAEKRGEDSAAPTRTPRKTPEQVKVRSRPPSETSGPSVPATPTTTQAGVSRMEAPQTAPPAGRSHCPPLRPRPSDGWFASGPENGWRRVDLADAWAEVEESRRSLEQRERELDLREEACRRAEARQRASQRQLSEMRRRLEDYSDELEETMSAVLAQQATLREERRRSAEVHARARRMLSAARSNGNAKWMDATRSPNPEIDS